ncbi:hypothetical protein ASG73_05635 [Janibacter sp. Soil728]|uniref:hypothetical protein n=1 Tax=Janibacter sp. Soil728 TaxID=1736393 RepID=UPI0006FE224E|nr:hypothetical protein [Janibacter sp. Soil728]KRE38422.1 hypothetical protein ASG73_05635 [Janibacter sp. Soil728]
MDAARRCVITPGDEVTVTGELTDGESPSVWVHQGFGLTGRVEGGQVRMEGRVQHGSGPARVTGVWDGQRIVSATSTPVADDAAPPVVLRASESLRGPQDLTDAERGSAMDTLYARAGDRLLGFGGTSHSTFACLLLVDLAFVDWWLDVSTLRIDLSIAMLPASLWDDAGMLPRHVLPGAHARP